MPTKSLSERLTGAIAELSSDIAICRSQPDHAPQLPQDFTTLLARLKAVEGTLPPVYEQTVFYPFVSSLLQMGAGQFSSLIDQNRPERNMHRLIFDLAQAILQFGEGYKRGATDAAQEVISDLFDGFLSAADRRAIKVPDKLAAAPLVKWGEQDSGPYIFPSEITSILGAGTGIVNMPPVYARRGLAAWSALPHEVAGHEILRADRGARLELSKLAARWIEDDVKRENGIHWFLAHYLAERIDEAASDVLGVLNMGPAALIGLIAFFKGLEANEEDEPGPLSGDAGDECSHPPPFLRALIMLETIKLCRMNGKDIDKWHDALEKIIDHEVDGLATNGGHRYLKIGNRDIFIERAREAARSFARAVVLGRLDALGGVSFGFVHNWTNADQEKAELLKEKLFDPAANKQLAEGQTSHVFASHAVAAAILRVVDQNKGENVQTAFDTMLELLGFMHDSNPVWAGTSTFHPGDIAALSRVHSDHAHGQTSDRIKFTEKGAYNPQEFTGNQHAARPRRTNAPMPGVSPDPGANSGLKQQGGMPWGVAHGSNIPSGGGVIFSFTPGGGVPFGVAYGGGVPFGVAQGGGVPFGVAQGGGVPFGVAYGGGVPFGVAYGGGVPWGFEAGGGPSMAGQGRPFKNYD